MVLALVTGGGWLIYLLAPILTPFAVAALFAYLGDPITDWLERRGLGRTLAVTVVFLTLSLLVVAFGLLLIPLLEGQILRLIEVLPAFYDWARQVAAPLLARLEDLGLATIEREQVLAMVQEHLQQASGIAATIIGSITRSGAAIVGWILNLVLIPVVAFYLLRDWDRLIESVRELLPRNIEPTVVQLTRESNAVLGSFLRGQLTVMLALGVIYSVGLWLVGLDLALLVGMLAGIVSFIPYLGAIVGVGAGVVGALFQYGDLLHVLLVVGVFVVGQMLEGTLLTPLLVGDKIGMHPVAVIFAVLAGGQLFGFLGILLALPAASVIMVLLRHAHGRYKGSSLYGAPDPLLTPGDEAEPAGDDDPAGEDDPKSAQPAP